MASSMQRQCTTGHRARIRLSYQAVDLGNQSKVPTLSEISQANHSVHSSLAQTSSGSSKVSKCSTQRLGPAHHFFFRIWRSSSMVRRLAGPLPHQGWISACHMQGIFHQRT
ncbi:uncharacterized protein [Anser cygnoides]|uniref:uncharacterized protein n=1 Tax=Anser cygnoides TaxID=8845 RepID=UPI0034D2B49F